MEEQKSSVQEAAKNYRNTFFEQNETRLAVGVGLDADGLDAIFVYRFDKNLKLPDITEYKSYSIIVDDCGYPNPL